MIDILAINAIIEIQADSTEDDMYTVEYNYYNYPSKIKTFDNGDAAKKFFWYIGKRPGVKKAEMKKV